jgi:hypothetical protein
VLKGLGIAIMLLFLGGSAVAQFSSPERVARKSIAKKRWTKAREQLNRAIAKDSINAAAEFLLARYFFHPLNPEYHVDSAYLHVNRSLLHLSAASSRERDRLKRDGIDSMRIVSQRQRVDSAAFDRARRINTEASFLHFLDTYKFASHREQATALRDEAAYLDAVKENTYEGFQRFLQKYPTASHASEAKEHYERLLYESKTAGRTLGSFEQFLEDYPGTPYRNIVEKEIFEISTAAGLPEQFSAFIANHAQSSYVKRARNILFHLGSNGSLSQQYLSDSLRHVEQLNRGFLVPFLVDGKYGFMDSRGKVIMKPSASVLPDEYRCGNITEEFLLLDNKLKARNESMIFNDSLADIADLGAGYLLVTDKACKKVIHKSGFHVANCVDDAKIVAENFVAVSTGGKWSMLALSGRVLFEAQWDDISSILGLVALKKGQKILLASPAEVGKIANQELLKTAPVFDAAKLWPSSKIWVQSGDLQGILNQDQSIFLELKRQELKQTFFGIIAKTESTISLMDSLATVRYTARELIEKQPFLAIRTDSTWRFVDHVSLSPEPGHYDSIYFAGPFPVALRKDSLDIFFLNNHAITVSNNDNISFLPGKDSTAFLMIQKDRKKTIYNGRGVRMFMVDFDDIQYAGEGFFVVSKKEKKGLLNPEGKLVLPIEYDAIGSVNRNMISLLRNMKFGAYNAQLKKLIKPQYDKNVIFYNPSLLAAYRDGYYGFVNWDNKFLTKTEYDEVQHWNDSIALVKKKNLWSLLDIALTKEVQQGIRDLEYIHDTPDEKLAIVKQNLFFGVWSNRYGYIVPATFTYLKNVGSTDEPVYFTEKHVEEASLFVVIYYDAQGAMLMRRVYEEEDYEKIVCTD